MEEQETVTMTRKQFEAIVEPVIGFVHITGRTRRINHREWGAGTIGAFMDAMADAEQAIKEVEEGVRP